MDASVIRMIKKGGYQRISEAYFQSNKFESLPAFSCAVDDLAMPFPAAADATGLSPPPGCQAPALKRHS